MITATISTYNREKYLPMVLESLKKQTLSRSLFEVVLVNNNSPGNTAEIAEKFKNENPDISFRYYLETQQGLSFGRNRGISESKGKYITFIDDDAFLSEDYLEVIYNTFEKDHSVAAIGSKILLHYESVIPKWENKYLNSLLGYFNMGDDYKVFPKSDYPRGSNMSFRTDVFQKAGMFNTELGRIGKGMGGGEEKDMFKRIYQLKDLKVIYIPNAVVFHCVPIERTTAAFIKNQAIGTGKSERIRVRHEGFKSTLNRFFVEF
ncbi:MAG: glycosyltransferase, partial [Crocinitomicaceae bacterium]|nr:glycosyltransferase [Crocinitomicaceae bacterium]